MITKVIDWEVRKELSKDDFLRIGVTWACLKNLGHLLCSSEALIIEVMGWFFEDWNNMGLLEKHRTLTLFKWGIDYWSDEDDEDGQIIKNEKCGPRVKGTWFTWRVCDDLGNLILCNSGEMWKAWGRRVRGDVLRIEGSRESWVDILNFFCKKLDESISQKLRRIYEWEQLVW